MGNRALCCGRVCPKVNIASNDLYEDSSCDPAGTVFRETLEDLNEVDRLLILFASSCNLAAVRWLVLLGANMAACDANGTTCLHAACRSGSLSVVRYLSNEMADLEATDEAGWSPLHVAAFMGRRSVAAHLMERGVQLNGRTTRGLAPVDLCSDSWLRQALLGCAAQRLRGTGTEEKPEPWRYDRIQEAEGDVHLATRLRFEPFFVPRTAPVKVAGVDLKPIGLEIINRRPGQGLAFLVATGCVRDFPIEISAFLLENRVNLARLGDFLGEEFSLSNTLRLEFFNSVRLTGTGVVSSLAKVFEQIHIPSDMQKIDRLVDGVAQIWWRQHEQHQGYPQPFDEDLSEERFGNDDEMRGNELMSVLANYGTLHQLMFSAVMLHWNLYAPLPPSKRLSLDQWLALSNDIGGPEDPTLQVPRRIYSTLSGSFVPQLQIWATNAQRGQGLTPREGLAASTADVEGWVRLVTGGFPSPAAFSGTATYQHVRGILSEATGTADLASPGHSRPGPDSQLDEGYEDGAACGPAMLPSTPSYASVFPRFDCRDGNKPRAPNGVQTDQVWLSLRQGLLFFAAKGQDWAPYAFLHLERTHVIGFNEKTLSLTLASSSAGIHHSSLDAVYEVKGQVDSEWCRTEQGPQQSSEEEATPIRLVLLLPDGRWQVLELQRVQIQVPDEARLQLWLAGLASKQESAWKANGETGDALEDI